jgi:hypothetical protein
VALHTRPTPEELLDGVIRTLDRQVRPALEDAVARDALASASGILRYLRAHWDGAAAGLVEEVEALEALMREAAPTVRAAGDEELAGRIEASAAGSGGAGARAHSALAARSEALHEALLGLVLAVERAEAGSALGALRPRALAELEGVNRRRL